MKKLPITKAAFDKSRYFKNKYGKLEYVSESGRLFKTNKGKILKFKESMENGDKLKVEMLCKDLERNYNTLKYDEIEDKLSGAGFQLDEYGGGLHGRPAYAVFVHPCGIVVNIEYLFVRTSPGKDSWIADDVTNFYWMDDPDYQRWSTESAKKFGKKFTKEAASDDIYSFYEWLETNTQYDSGIHVHYYDNEDGSETVELRFDDRYQWADDVEDGKISKDEDPGVKDWIALFERKASKNGWEFDTDEYEDEFSLTLRGSDEGDEDSYQEGTESNPRFKCMEDGEDRDNTRFLIEVVDEDGHYDEFFIDLADESDWGSINTADGSCYFPSGEEFDGIGWGNDEDGYLRIVSVRRNGYQDNEEEISTREFADIVGSLSGLYSDM